jgi:hypothetical protein
MARTLDATRILGNTITPTVWLRNKRKRCEIRTSIDDGRISGSITMRLTAS